jgi:hypothetical protein
MYNIGHNLVMVRQRQLIFVEDYIIKKNYRPIAFLRRLKGIVEE